MRLIAVVFGVLITLAGIVWGLQGLGVIPGSFMSNNPSWIWIGGGRPPVPRGPRGLFCPFRSPAHHPRPRPPRPLRDGAWAESPPATPEATYPWWPPRVAAPFHP